METEKEKREEGDLYVFLSIFKFEDRKGFFIYLFLFRLLCFCLLSTILKVGRSLCLHTHKNFQKRKTKFFFWLFLTLTTIT